MSLGQIKDYTPNFNLIIPRFDIATWHDYMESNFRSIDALFFNMFGINQYRGEWQNSTTYQVGDVLFIGDPDSQYTGRLVKVLVVHTTTANDSFDVYYAHNPINYDLFMDAAAAEQAAKLARDWAIKTDGKVQGLDYSAKYYANLITPISAEIVNVSNISNEVVNVSNISTNITNVDTISAEIVAVSSKLNEIITNSNNISSININSNNINDINTNATNINAININANNISAIQNAYANAQSALNSKNKAQEWAISENIVDNSDYSAKYYANQSQTSAELSAQYANDKINQTHITNCITEIPQDIKLELNNGTLTLKAGSKVYVPNGVGNFDVVNVSSDIALTQQWGANIDCLLFVYGRSLLNIMPLNRCSSGASDSISGSNHFYYNTANNTLRYIERSGNIRNTPISLPVAIVKMSGNGATVSSIQQVFNGFGYIGSTIFALPGVKGLIPNGRNKDGTLKNIEFSVNNVLTYTYTNSLNAVQTSIISNSSGVATGLNYRFINGTQTSGWYFNNQENIYTYNGNLMLWCDYGEISTSSGKIITFTPKTVFRAVDYNDFALDVTSSNTRNIGEIITSSIPLTDAGLHLLDGSLIQGGGIYDDFVQYIAGLVNTYPQCFCSEAEWQQSVNTYGACGKFVYSNNSIRLPKITGFIEGTIDSNALGDLVEAGLPDATIQIATETVTDASGTAYASSASHNRWKANQGSVATYKDDALFKLSKASTIYGNSNTVQPQSIKVFYYIVVANSTKTNIEVDIDEIVTDLNSKANNADVVHKTGNETITGHKVFTNNIDRNVNTIRGQTPSSNSYSDIRFVDNNNNWLAGLEYSLLTDKSSWISLIVSDSVEDTTNVKGIIQLGVYSDGNVYATAPTPNVSSNGTNIATTAYINAKFQVVSTLPANPDGNVYYFIPE